MEIPSEISFEDLSKIYNSKRDKSIDINELLTKKQVETFAENLLENLESTIPNPQQTLIFKVIALMIISKLAVWSDAVGHRVLNEIGTKEAIEWFEDVGALRVAGESLAHVRVHTDDFTC